MRAPYSSANTEGTMSRIIVDDSPPSPAILHVTSDWFITDRENDELTAAAALPGRLHEILSDETFFPVTPLEESGFPVGLTEDNALARPLAFRASFITELENGLLGHFFPVFKTADVVTRHPY